jgi:hypothetical protein
MATGAEVQGFIQFGRAAEQVYADRRFSSPRHPGGSLREFVIALAYARYCEPARRDKVHVAAERCGGWQAVWLTVHGDVPRYQPDGEHERGCVAQLPRAKRPCGRSTNQAFRVTDPCTGQWRLVGYCHRHRADADQVHTAEQARIRTGDIPEPVPNQGGLLASYFGARWAKRLYRWADPRWAPGPYGVSADDWPAHRQMLGIDAPELPVVASRPRLAVVNGEADGDLGEPPSRPDLAVVRFDGGAC